MKFFIVDRMEENYYILEMDDQSFIEVPKEQIPKEAKEGSVLFLSNDHKYQIDIQKTNERKEKLFNLQNRIFKP